MSEPSEDRGTPARIWISSASDECSFEEPSGCLAYQTYDVSVPCGWSPYLHPELGTRLKDVYGKMLDAESVLELAMHKQEGFRLRK